MSLDEMTLKGTALTGVLFLFAQFCLGNLIYVKGIQVDISTYTNMKTFLNYTRKH